MTVFLVSIIPCYQLIFTTKGLTIQDHVSWWPGETHLQPLIINPLRLRQNDRHFAGDIFKCIFLNEDVWISHKISLKFVPEVGINNIPALVQIMAWCRPGTKPLSEPMKACFTDAYLPHSASMSWLSSPRICQTQHEMSQLIEDEWCICIYTLVN